MYFNFSYIAHLKTTVLIKVLYKLVKNTGKYNNKIHAENHP